LKYIAKKYKKSRQTQTLTIINNFCVYLVLVILQNNLSIILGIWKELTRALLQLFQESLLCLFFWASKEVRIHRNPHSLVVILCSQGLSFSFFWHDIHPDNLAKKIKILSLLPSCSRRNTWIIQVSHAPEMIWNTLKAMDWENQLQR
jgi:hypothetical protein